MPIQGHIKWYNTVLFIILLKTAVEKYPLKGFWSPWAMLAFGTCCPI